MRRICGTLPSAIRGTVAEGEVHEALPEGAGRPPVARHLVLIGLPGAGKTTVGRAVSKELHRPFIDVDAEIEHMFGKSVSQIFAEHGEAAFRASEAEVSARLAGSTAAAVIAPGGGWVANESATAHLRASARIIYLRVSPDEAVRRMGSGVARRPLLASGEDVVSALDALHERRRQAYEELADWTVETGGLRRSQVVARLLELVRTDGGITTVGDG